MQYGDMGTVSHGTLRTEDLLASLGDELERLAQVNGQLEEHGALLHVVRLWKEKDNDTENDEHGTNMVCELIDTLSTCYAMPYMYFGTHPGDGSDYGFWPDMESVNELPRISDPNELPTGEDCVHVNDHGNVSVYGGDGALIWDCV